MGIDKYLACRTCHVFIDLHKWLVVEELKDDWPFEFEEYFVELKDQIAAIRKAFERLVSNLEKENNEAD